MTASRWFAQLALGNLLEDGVQIVAHDAMQVPLVALRPGVRFVSAVPEVLLDAAAGGVIVRDRVRAMPDRPRRCLAIAPTLEEAVELGRRAWGCAAHLVSDGLRLGMTGDRVVVTAEAVPSDGLKSRKRSDPLRFLPTLRDIGDTEILETGEVVLWIDALRCLRGLTLRLACRIAWRGRVTHGDVPEMRLSVPAGRSRLHFEEVRSPPQLKVAESCRVNWVDDATVEIDAGEAHPGGNRVLVDAPRARIRRVGIVIPAGIPLAKTALPDPLASYADPINGDSQW